MYTETSTSVENQTPTKSRLSGRWHTAIAAESIVILSELLLIAVGFQSTYILIAVTLVSDLLILSPMKAGRSLLYDTLSADPSGAGLGLLFRYYRHGYRKTILWRLLLWIRLALCAILFSVPTIALLLLRHFWADNQLIWLSLTFCSYLTTAASAIGLIILMCLYTPSAYLLPYSPSATKAVKLSRQLFKGKHGALLQSYRYLFYRFPFFLLLFPLFYLLPSFRIQQAADIRRIIGRFPEKKWS